MKPKVPFKLVGAAARQVAQLDAWWRSRSADLKLRETYLQEKISPRVHAQASDDPSAALSFHQPFDVHVKPGDVRLLAPDILSCDIRRLAYVAVLAVYPDDGLCLVAPFSKYGVPATSGEWATGFSGWPIRVMQLWNARTAPTALIARSWLTVQLTTEERRMAKQVLNSITSGTRLCAEIRERTGLPIVKADDPRLAYQAEDQVLFAPLTEAVSAMVEAGAGLAKETAILPWLESCDYVQMAAASASQDVMVPLLWVISRDKHQTRELSARRMSCSYDPEEGWEIRWSWPLGGERAELSGRAPVLPGLPVVLYVKKFGQPWKPFARYVTSGDGHLVVCSGEASDLEAWNLLSGQTVQAKIVIYSEIE